MFTGIIHILGKVVEKKGTKELCSFVIEIPSRIKNVTLGSSIAINGVCLTLTKKKGTHYHFDVMKETLDKTTLSSVSTGNTVHVEPSLKVGDEIGGHFVYGHVDGIGKVKQTQKIADTLLLTVVPPKNLLKYCVPQGSITVNGVSLTIARLTKTSCTVSLVPFTLQKTNLASLKKGETVNIECDMLAKYIIHQ